MAELETIAKRIAATPHSYTCEPSPAPSYQRRDGENIMLAMKSFSRHMTDEGWQLQCGLRKAGYRQVGHGYEYSETRVPEIIRALNPSVVIVQDKREWDIDSPACFEPESHFHDIEALRRDDIFRVTILKDAHQQPDYNREFAEQIGCHAWITYYHPDLVCHLAPYVRREHLIRTYHSVNPKHVPKFSIQQRIHGCLLSGAKSIEFYPLRRRLWKHRSKLPDTKYMQHPGYGLKGAHTPEYLRQLQYYKVAVCTASIFGYSLRKIIEATACGCRVITDLPEDEVLPEIDGNLIRVNNDAQPAEVADVIAEAEASYDSDRQRHFAAKAVEFYDYKKLTAKIAADIERLRT